MYAGEKKESIARMTNANALTKTPETTAGTAPNTNISITNKNVNRPRPWATAKRGKIPSVLFVSAEGFIYHSLR